MLFPQLARIVERYVREKVEPVPPAAAPGRLPVAVLRLGDRAARRGHPSRPVQGEAPEVPRYETSRGPGSTADVDYWTSRDVREVDEEPRRTTSSPTPAKWEQSAAYILDTHPRVDGVREERRASASRSRTSTTARPHDYVPDFIVRLKTEPRRCT